MCQFTYLQPTKDVTVVLSVSYIETIFTGIMHRKCATDDINVFTNSLLNFQLKT